MQRVTLTLDDDLLAALDALSARRGYHNRSEAVRDILRDALNQILRRRNHGAGMPSCRTCMNMKNANWRAGWWPPSIIITISVATLHVHISHDDCPEIAVLKGDMAEVQHFADDVIAQRGVRHGHLQCLADD